jgi:hypothetical protein
MARVLPADKNVRPTVVKNERAGHSSPSASRLLVHILWASINVTSPGYTWNTTASLYDGDTLLGTHTSTRYGDLGPNIFKKAGSIYTYGNPSTVDFTSFDNKTIDGRIDFHVSGGSL